MKLYDFTRAPNPRRVRVFLAEKGITVPMEQVDLFTGANRTPEALRRNPYGGLPVSREASLAQMRMIDGLIAGRRFIAGERYTIADITAMVALGLGAVVGLTVDPGLANLTRWYGEVSARPSARA